jgi:glutathione S-transferase
MSIVLYHHPFTRAATVVWMLEEVSAPYELRWLDLMKGEGRSPEYLALNPMGKLPTLVDDGTVVTEVAAIGLYLADRHAAGRLSPPLDDPRRGTYYRWSLFAPSVVEPGSMAKMAGWSYKASQAGWGEYATMLDTMEKAIGAGPFLLGEQFTMADVIFGGTLRYMMRFDLVEKRPAFTAYGDRRGARPALQRAEARNAAMAAEHGLKM